MKKFAIFSACIGGGYDNVYQPLIVDERFDYLLFTDNVLDSTNGVWQMRKVEYVNGDKTRIARYVKTHPEELLPEYEATLWMDANVQIITNDVYERFIELYNKKSLVASIKHYYRSCIYDEAFIVSYAYWCKFEHDTTAIGWCGHIYRDSYPRNNGLFETGILYRKRCDKVGELDCLWWSCINSYSKRDQLSFNYSVWKSNISVDYFFRPGEVAAQSNKVHLHPHQKVSKRKFIKLNLLEWLRYKAFKSSVGWPLAYFLWHRFYQLPHPVLALNVIGTLISLLISPVVLFVVLFNRCKRLLFSKG